MGVADNEVAVAVHPVAVSFLLLPRVDLSVTTSDRGDRYLRKTLGYVVPFVKGSYEHSEYDATIRMYRSIRYE